jgi:DNA-directed RNA polymerase specialized sigma24 family protein
VPAEEFDVNRLKAHDHDEWLKVGPFIEEYLRSVFGASLQDKGVDVRDVCQDAYIKAWKGIKGFEPRRAGIKGWFRKIASRGVLGTQSSQGSGIKTWLRTIADHAAVDCLRKQGREVPFPDPEPPDDSTEGLGILPPAIAGTAGPTDPDIPRLRKALDILARLDPFGHACVTLYAEGKTIREIAEETGTPPASAHRHLKSVLKRLKDIFDNLERFEG